MDKIILSPIELQDLLNGLRSIVKEELQAQQQIQTKSESRKPISVEKAAAITNLSRSRIYALAPSGAIPNIKKGGRLYFYEDELLAWLESGKRLSKSEIDTAADNALLKKKTA
ncbi:MAG TPA: helix-turn-helix domain-containing protein [Parafilimonas sp.]|nr:helix-turn-helix domain-containing protein [Parafilimonas sp.]